MKINAATKKAVETLAAGGYFRKALEQNYFGHEKFRVRLYDASRRVVSGAGFATLHSLLRAGMLERRECVVTSDWPEEWQLAQEVR